MKLEWDNCNEVKEGTINHTVIMPEDCYISETGRYKGCVVRKSSMGVEVKLGFDEVRYVFGGKDAIEQAYLHTAFEIEVEMVEQGTRYVAEVKYKPKLERYKIVAFTKDGRQACPAYQIVEGGQ